MEKTWNCVFEFLWEPCLNYLMDFFKGCMDGTWNCVRELITIVDFDSIWLGWQGGCDVCVSLKTQSGIILAQNDDGPLNGPMAHIPFKYMQIS